MRKWIGSLAVNAFSRRYNFDVAYLRQMLRETPDAFFAFANVNTAARYRRKAPVDAIFAVKLTGTLSEDCGPCVQLVADMAREAGMGEAQIIAVLRRDEVTMNRDAGLGFRFADTVVRRLDGEDEAREAVRQAWGDAGVIELSLALALTRVYPMLKAGMGFAKECRRVRISGREVEVVKHAG